MNPPDSQRCRMSVPSGNSSSGWWRTSTNTESSAFTSGFRRSSRVFMMSWGRYRGNKVKYSLLQVNVNKEKSFFRCALVHLQLLDDVLVVPGVGRSARAGEAGGGFVVWIGARQRVQSWRGQHGVDLSLQFQRHRDGATLSWTKFTRLSHPFLSGNVRENHGNHSWLRRNAVPGLLPVTASVLMHASTCPLCCCCNQGQSSSLTDDWSSWVTMVWWVWQGQRSNQLTGTTPKQFYITKVKHFLHLQRSAVFRERGAEEGVDGVKNHADDVFLQNGIGKTLFSFITDLQRGKNPKHQHHVTSGCFLSTFLWIWLSETVYLLFCCR